MEKITYVFGHKNPDTDSVVSAYAFAELKNLTFARDGITDSKYVAARAGKLSPQTEFVFNKFQITPPEFHSDLTPKVEYYMRDDFYAVKETQSLQSASELMQKKDFHFLFVTDQDGKYKSLLHYSVFAKNLINSLNPEHHIKVFTNLKLLRQSLNALSGSDVSLFSEDSDYSECTIITGASDIESFKKTVSERSEQRLIIITGDREDLISYAISKKVYCIVVTGGRSVSIENIQKAKENSVCILITPFDTASTSMLTAYATPVSKIADYSIKPVKKSDSISKVKGLFRKAPGFILPVVDDDYKVTGLISENMIHGEPKISVSLVDHNELSQAVDGLENYSIRQIIDHHRIGSISTKTPVNFINITVGSTATIIANLFFQEKVTLSAQTAGLLLAGILSDTLILKSATTTETDTQVALKLAQVAGVDLQSFGQEMLDAGCKLADRSAGEIVLQDLKLYNEDSVTFTVSQIEVGNTDEILSRKEELLAELEKQRIAKKVDFSALLITDITQLDSLLLMDGDQSLGPLVNFPPVEEKVYFLKGIVSRKKQLIPLLSELIKRM